LYQESLNPPILHRKELLLPPGHPARPQFQALTASLEALGVFQTAAPIGFKRQWTELLADAGYSVDGHTLIPIGNRIAANAADNISYHPPATLKPVARHLTALSRDRLSAPLRFLEKFGFLNGSFSVFDYGCGKGDDLRYLRAINVPSNGWDPHYQPNDPLVPSDFVNLGFVINVIEDLAERQYALTRAFSLARIATVVSTMLASDQRKAGLQFRDGFISSIGTFQKYYLQHELQSFIDGVLDDSPIPADNRSCLTTISSLYDTLKLLFMHDIGQRTDRSLRFNRPTDERLDSYEQLAVDYFTALGKAFKPVGKLLKSKRPARVTAAQRGPDGGHLVFRPIGLDSVTRVAIELSREKEVTITEAVAALKDIPTDLAEAPYRDVIWSPATHTILPRGKALARDLIRYMVGLPIDGNLLHAQYRISQGVEVDDVSVGLPEKVN
jgi:hypothetical protein